MHRDTIGQVPLATDSRSLLSLSFADHREKTSRLPRAVYEKRDINDFVWNPADALTKETKRNNSLAEVTATNKFIPKAESWIKRDYIVKVSE